MEFLLFKFSLLENRQKGAINSIAIWQNCPRQKKEEAIQRLRRKGFQTGSVRLRTDRGPAYWQVRYWEGVATEGGKIERTRRSVKLGYLEDIPSKREAQQKLAVILKPINDLDQIPKMRITFREFIERYRSLKLVNKKRTTIHGYETNIRVHYRTSLGG